MGSRAAQGPAHVKVAAKLAAHWPSRGDLTRTVNEVLALMLFRERSISCSEAAEALNVSSHEIVALFAKHRLDRGPAIPPCNATLWVSAS